MHFLDNRVIIVLILLEAVRTMQQIARERGVSTMGEGENDDENTSSRHVCSAGC